MISMSYYCFPLLFFLVQNVAPVSFKLAVNTLKNCSADLKTYLPEAVGSLDVPIEDYAEVVVSLFQEATQKQITVCLTSFTFFP